MGTRPRPAAWILPKPANLDSKHTTLITLPLLHTGTTPGMAVLHGHIIQATLLNLFFNSQRSLPLLP